MLRVEKTVFISYRRTNVPWALAIYQSLTQSGFDVFFDYNGIASGNFERVILENIRSRAHFLIVLTPSALERCGEPGDWLRREIEEAMESRRNIVPLMLESFDFGAPAIASQLTGKLATLRHYNGMGVSVEYFADGALQDYTEAIRLRPDYFKAFYNRGLTRTAKGDLEGALEDLDEAIRLEPNDSDAYDSRAIARRAKGDLEGAQEDIAVANGLRRMRGNSRKA